MNTLVVELCMGSSCFARGNAKALGYLESFIEQNGLAERIELTGHLCLESCSHGPNVKIGDITHTSVRPEEIVALVKQALAGSAG